MKDDQNPFKWPEQQQERDPWQVASIVCSAACVILLMAIIFT